MKWISKSMIVLILLASLLAACSPAEAPAPVETGAASISSTQAENSILPTEGPTTTQSLSAGKFPIGKFESVKEKSLGMRFIDDGTFEQFAGGGKEPVFIGTYKVDGNLITTENPNETDPTCIGPATYEWFYDGMNLTFAPHGEDPCKPRRETNAEKFVLVDALPQIRIEAVDYSYKMPQSLKQGWIRVILSNNGKEPHHVQLMRLNDGVSFEQFTDALKSGEGPAMALVSNRGGVGVVAPGETAQAIINLPAGDYAVMCLVPSPSDQMPHFTKGMIQELEVASEFGMSDEPNADLEVSLQDFGFDMPDSLTPGLQTIKVSNLGPEPHEMNLLKLADGKSLEDVIKYLSATDGPPPFVPVGGINGLDAGLIGFIEADLRPGNYVAICNIPSPANQGKPHASLGMIKPFSVQVPNALEFPMGRFTSEKDPGRAYEFLADGTFKYYFGGETPVVTGIFSVVGSMISVRNPGETEPQCQGTVTYKWSFEGGKLSFTPLGEDPCKARADSFADSYLKQ